VTPPCWVDWPFAALAQHPARVADRTGAGPDGWSDWSDEQTVVAAFLSVDEWQAQFIGLAAPTRKAQPVLLRTEFEVAPGLERRRCTRRRTACTRRT